GLKSISRFSPTGQFTNASSVTFQATFSGAVTGVAASNFKLTGTAGVGTIGTPTSSDSIHWSIPVSNLASGNGTLELDLANNSGITGSGGNALSTTTFSGQSYTLDHMRPTLTSINRFSPSNQLTNASSVTFQATFSEAVSGVAVANFALSGTAAAGTIGTPSTTDSGMHWSITVTGLGSANGTLELDLANNTSITDLASNPLSTITLSGQSYTLNHIALTLTSTIRFSPSSQLTNASSVTFQATFSVAVTGVAKGNFALSGTAGITNSAMGTPSTAD